MTTDATPPIRRREEKRPDYSVYSTLSDCQSALKRLVAEPSKAVGLAGIVNDLDRLLGESAESVGGRVFRPTPHAYVRARHRIMDVYALVGDRLPAPSFIPDGEGGIDIEWVSEDGHEVTLSCRAKPSQKDYIYRDGHGTSLDVSLASLLENLGALSNA